MCVDSAFEPATHRSQDGVITLTTRSQSWVNASVAAQYRASALTPGRADWPPALHEVSRHARVSGLGTPSVGRIARFTRFWQSQQRPLYARHIRRPLVAPADGNDGFDRCSPNPFRDKMYCI
ncbi:hypothetical protein BJY52DRAFT_1230515 [Lactarius psammicola]|nr:hypothetical protein BJY52DRAFT_1230515 [Lactarius psammicola]